MAEFGRRTAGMWIGLSFFKEKVMDSGQPAQLFVKAFRLEQRIGVCVTRGGWDHCFRIKVVNGEIPKKYRSDPQIMAAYKVVRAHYEKQQRKQLGNI